MPIRTKTKRIIKKRDVLSGSRKKFCRLCLDKTKAVDYKDVKRLEAFIRERGKILSTRISGNCAKHQRMVAEAIKKARYLSLIPYTRI
ncbi:MAG: 30S ribosomal protein S18 [Candidatus Omnitrophica bacterium]|nr:30S ribosomal protein S18 [Candidatus Omnitrophota bacterium]MDD5592959.1 30S ribosomal protein S18 [Candidatus Omnitrophota bacterium]